MFPWNMFPFNKNMKDTMQNMKPAEIDKYVQDLIGKIMPENMRGMMNPQDMFGGAFGTSVNQQQTATGALQSNAFETHDYVFVRIPLKNEEWVRNMRIYHTSNQLIVEHIPTQEDRHVITLPSIVKKKGATANFKDGTLEVRIPKNIDMQFSEIDVTEIM